MIGVYMSQGLSRERERFFFFRFASSEPRNSLTQFDLRPKFDAQASAEGILNIVGVCMGSCRRLMFVEHCAACGYSSYKCSVVLFSHPCAESIAREVTDDDEPLAITQCPG